MTLYHDHMTVVNDRDRLLTALVDVTSRLALHAPRGNSDVLDKAKLAIGNRGTHALAGEDYEKLRCALKEIDSLCVAADDTRMWPILAITRPIVGSQSDGGSEHGT
jgi:hypothetical protein